MTSPASSVAERAHDPARRVHVAWAPDWKCPDCGAVGSDPVDQYGQRVGAGDTAAIIVEESKAIHADSFEYAEHAFSAADGHGTPERAE